ncbi:hypothetical protein B0F90DRAFT_1685399, partial [Multifurca ochricompacta]
MKRPREGELSSNSNPSSPSTERPARPATKRAKASQACTSCRKHKTRCDLNIDNSLLTRVRRHVLKNILSVPETNPEQCLEPTQSEILASTSRSPTTSPWEFLKVPGIPDWTATPMRAMFTLSKMACKGQPTMQPITNLALTEILTENQRQYLLSLFESRYAPWLSLPPNAHSLGEDPVLDLVRCTVASRHLESSTHTRVFPTLLRLTEEAIVKHVFNPTPSPAIIQAFALLALCRLIAAAAINMCSSLRFDQAATDEQVLNERRKLGAELTSQETTLLTASEQKTSLVTSSSVCIGTGRGISSKITDYTLSSLSPLNFSTLPNARRTRLLLSTKIFNLAESGLRLEISEDHNKFESYCDESAELLYRFDGLQRVITSVHVVTDIEVFYAHMLIVYFYFCRLAFVVHILRRMRVHIPTSVAARGGTVFLSSKITRTGCGFALTCARDALASAEALLTTILSVAEKELLATAPDSVYAMISFAAAYITTAKFLLLQSRVARHLPGASEELLTRTINRLQHVSLCTDDNASRCARVISGFMETWHERLNAHHFEAAGENPVDSGDGSQSTSPVPLASKTKPYESTSSEGTMEGPSPQITSSLNAFDYMISLDQDTLFGPDFWQFFADVPNVHHGVNPTCEYT